MSEETGDAPLDVELKELNSLHYPRTNQLARISLFIAVGATIGGFYPAFATDYSWMNLFLFCLVLISAFGAFCGHCACRQLRARRYNQEGIAMAVFGLIFCYVYLGLGAFLLWVSLVGILGV